jgi:preprotein translocase subunit SecG
MTDDNQSAMDLSLGPDLTRESNIFFGIIACAKCTRSSLEKTTNLLTLIRMILYIVLKNSLRHLKMCDRIHTHHWSTTETYFLERKLINYTPCGLNFFSVGLSLVPSNKLTAALKQEH